MIEVKVSKKIKTYKGISNLTVEHSFPQFSITKVFGPSGAGKTTFLKIIAGLLKPETGVLTVNGQTWLNTAEKINWSPQERRVGFVFQDYALFPNMTVLQHLKYATADPALIQRLLHLGQMDSFADHRPAHLSGGQQQRLAILRALALKPKLLLLDEAFSALDDELRETLIADLKSILKEFGTTTIIVSHHAKETENFVERSLKIELE